MGSGRGEALTDTFGADTLPAAASDAAQRLAQLRPGMALSDRYVLTRRLGAGGMGEVWEGQHALIERPIAIKFFAGSRTDTDAVKRFWREAKATAALRHPGIVDVIDFGATEEGLPYIVMELLRGRPLSAALAEDGALPWPRAQALLLELTAALGHAHRRGIIHRDLKPSNIFLAREDDDPHERCKLIDFGIAKLTRADAASTLQTGTGLVLGTLAYMSPEQLGDRPLDARSDIYSLGCVAYEVLTGRRPFQDASPTGLVLKHLFDRPASPREHAPEIPVDVEAVVLRALCKDPDNRFQSMAEMHEAVERLGSGAPPVHVPRETPAARAAAQDSQIAAVPPARPGLRLALAAAVVAGAAGAWWAARAISHVSETMSIESAQEPESDLELPAPTPLPVSAPELAPAEPASEPEVVPPLVVTPEISPEPARAGRRRPTEPPPEPATPPVEPTPEPPPPAKTEPPSPAKTEPPPSDDTWEKQRRLKSPFAPDDP
jgi:serine/threonine protein kinase